MFLLEFEMKVVVRKFGGCGRSTVGFLELG